MTEWTFVTIPTTSIGEMELAPNMLLALVGLGISRRTPCNLLSFLFLWHVPWLCSVEEQELHHLVFHYPCWAFHR